MQQTPIMEKKIQFVTAPNCNGGVDIIGLYNRQAKTILVEDRNSYGSLTGTYKETPISEFFEDMLSRGSYDEKFQKFLSVPDFKSLWEQTEKELAPAFTVGEKVAYIKTDHYGKAEKALIVTVGEVVGWRKTCDAKEKKPVWQCCRLVIQPGSTKHVEVFEENLTPLSDFQTWEAGVSAVKKLKTAMKKEDLFGAVILHDGKVYEV